MSNLTDVMLWAAQEDAAGTLPALSAIQAALASVKTYPNNGTQVAPGVILVDATNGLFHITALDQKGPGQFFCATPGLASLDPAGPGYATTEWNTANARGSEGGFGLWVRVRPATKQDSQARPYILDKNTPWLPNAWSVPAEYDTWDKVTYYLMNKWNMPG